MRRVHLQASFRQENAEQLSKITIWLEEVSDPNVSKLKKEILQTLHSNVLKKYELYPYNDYPLQNLYETYNKIFNCMHLNDVDFCKIVYLELTKFAFDVEYINIKEKAECFYRVHHQPALINFKKKEIYFLASQHNNFMAKFLWERIYSDNNFSVLKKEILMHLLSYTREFLMNSSTNPEQSERHYFLINRIFNAPDLPDILFLEFMLNAIELQSSPKSRLSQQMIPIINKHLKPFIKKYSLDAKLFFGVGLALLLFSNTFSYSNTLKPLLLGMFAVFVAFSDKIIHCSLSTELERRLANADKENTYAPYNTYVQSVREFSKKVSVPGLSFFSKNEKPAKIFPQTESILTKKI